VGSEGAGGEVAAGEALVDEVAREPLSEDDPEHADARRSMPTATAARPLLERYRRKWDAMCSRR
jgi:hypothetical protein